MLRLLLVFFGMFLCYQSAEAVGTRLLHSAAVQGALMTATIPLGMLLAWLAWRAPLRGFAMQPRSGALRWLVLGLLGAGALKLLAVGLGARLGAYTVGAAPAGEAIAPVQLATGVALAALTTFIPSLAEDMLTRGLPGAGWPWRGPAAFVLCSTALYVLNHTWRLANGPLEWLMLAAFGAAYAMAMACAGSLWAAVGLHWGWNLANALLPLGLQVEVADRATALLMSTGAHGLLLLALMAWWVRRGPAPAGALFAPPASQPARAAG